jgi:hypothetical protein
VENLKNIKPDELVTIDLATIGWIVGLFITIFLVVKLIFFVAKLKKRKPTKQELAIKYLKNLDLETLCDKQIAYQFTKYGTISLNPYFEDEFVKIVRQLKDFKYKKDVPLIDKDLKEQIKEYIKARI